MKKIKQLLFLSVIAIGATSCVSTSTMITDNPVGTKTGVARLKLFAKDKDFSIEKAAKNGSITKIGTVEVKTTLYLIFPVIETTVTGE